MKLRESQKKVRDFMIKSKCKSGILMWHYMGTGKTLAAISIAENIAQDVLIVCPAYLTEVWRTELFDKEKGWLKLGKSKTLKKKYTIISHDDNKNLFKRFDTNILIIVDEVQNCFVMDHPERRNVLAFARKCATRVLLSGTPVRTIENLGTIMPVVRGIEDDMNPQMFIDRYVYVSWFDKFVEKITLLLIPFELLNPVLMIVFNTFAGAAPIVLLSIMSVIHDLFISNKLSSWNTKQITEDFHKDISFVADPASSESGEKSFPSLRYETHSISTSTRQVNLGGRWVGGYLSEEEAEILGVSEQGLFILLDPKTLNNTETFMNYGRGIGMYDKDHPKNSTKGKHLIKLLKKLLDKNEKVMIFSEIEGMCGYSGVKKILDFYKYDYVEIDSRESVLKNKNSNIKFNNDEVKLILFFNVAEGISLKGCRHVIFMEPILNDIAKYQQVIGRARRLESHSHLPKEKRNVIAYTLVSVLPKPGEVRTKILRLLDSVEYGATTLSMGKTVVQYFGDEVANANFNKGWYEKLREMNQDIIPAQNNHNQNYTTPDQINKLIKTIAKSDMNLKTNSRFMGTIPNSILVGPMSAMVLAGMTFMKPFVIILKFFVAPRTYIRYMTNWFKNMFTNKRDLEMARTFAGVETSDSFETTPDMIVFKTMNKGINSINKLIDDISQKNLQTLVYWSSPLCPPCSAWPENPQNMQDSCNRLINST